MRLLLDEMYWPALAEQLGARGHDVIAASTHAHLSGIPDDDLFAAAQLEQRAVVTENVDDFVPIVQDYAAAGTAHHGLVLVAPSAYPRDRAHKEATLGALVTALDALLRQDPDTSSGAWTTWLLALSDRTGSIASGRRWQDRRSSAMGCSTGASYS